MRLIDADALKEELNNWAVDLTKSKFPHYIKDDADCIIDNAPTIAALPVRHGRWEDKGTITDEKAEVITEWQSARCTYCNKYHTTPYLYYFDNFAYCPNCGARMDGGKNE